MWAEKLYDNSFEGLLPYKFVYLKQTDFKEKPWYPSGATNRADYSLDSTTKISGKVSQKIEVADGAPCRVGISQDGLAVNANDPCTFCCFMRQQGIKNPVSVRVQFEGRIIASCEFLPLSEWQKFSAKLVFADSQQNATLSISFRGPGTLWLDNVSLMPEHNIGGWRPDVVEAVRAVKAGIIRYGGSALDDHRSFQWTDVIGDPDKRKPFAAWGGLQPTGPGLEEIVQFCQYVNAEPLICVRVEGRTPQDAVEELEYFNGSLNTPMGKLRAQNGHPEPYHIKYWQIGNERAGADYETRLASFCQAMKKADPSISLMTSFPSQGVIRNGRDYIDYVCPHHYSSDFTWMESDLKHTRELIEQNANGRPIKVGITEWNNTAGDAGPRRAMLWNLNNGLHCARYHNLMHRYCDLVEIANRSNMINSFCSGFIQVDRYRLYKTPAYYVQQLYSMYAGNQPLKVQKEKDSLDLSATLSSDGKKVIVFIVNTTLEDLSERFDFSAFGKDGQKMIVRTVADRDHAGEPDVTNSFSDPQRVISRQSLFTATSPRFDYFLPALSLTVLQWEVTK